MVEVTRPNQVASQAVKRIFSVSMSVIGDVSNPQLVKEEVVSARKLVLTSCGEEGDCVSKKRSTREIRTKRETERDKKEERRDGEALTNLGGATAGSDFVHVTRETDHKDDPQEAAMKEQEEEQATSSLRIQLRWSRAHPYRRLSKKQKSVKAKKPEEGAF